MPGSATPPIARRYYPIVHQVAVALLDDIAQMNAETKDIAAVRRHAGIARPRVGELHEA
jgi:hypothetical protein